MKDYVDIRVRVPIEMHERMEKQAKAEYSNISEVTRRLWVAYLKRTNKKSPDEGAFLLCGGDSFLPPIDRRWAGGSACVFA